ncbi:MAG: GNAT family N-acetyltransferase [Thermoplasmata archaeon]|nr:GNAT family N-acetyltransferase [Thermoplasmata archaeon]
MAPARTRSRGRSPYTVRRATQSDLATLVAHRTAMWRELRRFSERDLTSHAPEYLRWMRPRLRDGRVVAWIAETADGHTAASGAMWYQPSLPRPGMPQQTSPYIFTMFTEPPHRGHSLATRIVRLMLGASRHGGHARVLLHASNQGRPVYRRIGFERTWEMRFWLDARLAHVPRKRAPPRPARPRRSGAS